MLERTDLHEYWQILSVLRRRHVNQELMWVDVVVNLIVVLSSQVWRHHRAERLRQPRKDISTHHPSNSAVRVRRHDAEGGVRAVF